jgi:predicted nucleotidyltransferase
MSGNFTQRAEPAIIEKHIRAKSAILCGADAVLEIPTAFATGNAEVFAKAGVQLANVFPHSAYLVFGVEDNNLSILQKIAETQFAHQRNFDKYIKQHLKLGISYENARCEVIKKLLPQIPAETVNKIMNGSNNILAIEYLRELYRLKSKITPVSILRKGATHTEQNLQENFTSALALREAIYESPLQLADYIPEKLLPITEDALNARPQKTLFESAVLFGALTELNAKNTYNATAELSNLFNKNKPVSFEEMGKKIPNRRYSISRVSRIALHSTIGVQKNDIAFLYKYNCVPYTNLLGIRTDADELFAELCSCYKTAVIVRGNKNKPKHNAYTRRMQQIDRTANTLYSVVCKTKFAEKPSFVEPLLLLE